VAFRELQAGRKTSHWIWYVFPQLAGLGRSSTAVYYGLAGGEEAADYLCDRVLGERLVAAAAAVRTHLADGKARAVRLEELMGSQIDALKLVSCMTLFRHVAKTLFGVDPQPSLLPWQSTPRPFSPPLLLTGTAAAPIRRSTCTGSAHDAGAAAPRLLFG
jgi:uncharacterized protein (DUF1810 family)